MAVVLARGRLGSVLLTSLHRLLWNHTLPCPLSPPWLQSPLWSLICLCPRNCLVLKSLSEFCLRRNATPKLCLSLCWRNLLCWFSPFQLFNPVALLILFLLRSIETFPWLQTSFHPYFFFNLHIPFSSTFLTLSPLYFPLSRNESLLSPSLIFLSLQPYPMHPRPGYFKPSYSSFKNLINTSGKPFITSSIRELVCWATSILLRKCSRYFSPDLSAPRSHVLPVPSPVSLKRINRPRLSSAHRKCFFNKQYPVPSVFISFSWGKKRLFPTQNSCSLCFTSNTAREKAERRKGRFWMLNKVDW